MMKKIMLLMGLCLVAYTTYAGYPAIETRMTVTLPNGNQVTFYKDSEGEKVLYFLPTRLVPTTLASGKKALSVVLYDKVTNWSSSTGSSITYDTHNGGVMDCVLELSAGTKDITELRQFVIQQYPELKGWALAMVPLNPGTSSVSLSHQSIDPSVTQMSGAPMTVSGELGAPMPVRVLLSEIDGEVLLAKSQQGNGTMGGFNASFSGEAFFKMPDSHVKVKLNKRRVYSRLESHFQSKGGIFFASWAVDLKKLRENLEESGDISFDIVSAPGGMPVEQLQAMAERLIERYALELFKLPPLPNMKNTLSGLEKTRWEKRGFFPWASIGTRYSRTKIDQTVDKTITLDWRASAIDTFLVHLNADLGEISSDMITTVDLNRGGYFSEMGLLISPPSKQILGDPTLDIMKIDVTANYNGQKETHTATFSSSQMASQYTRFKLNQRAEVDQELGGIKLVALNSITYKVYVKMNNGLGEWEHVEKEYQIHASPYTLPAISAKSHIGYTEIKLGSLMFEDFPNLSNLQLSFENEKFNGHAHRLNRRKQEISLIFNPNDAPGSIDILARFRASQGTNSPSTSSVRRLSNNNGYPREIWIDDTDINGIFQYGR